MIVYLLWLLMVILWNFGVPKASPFEDVAMAVIIGFISFKLKEYLPKTSTPRKQKYFGNKKQL